MSIFRSKIGIIGIHHESTPKLNRAETNTAPYTLWGRLRLLVTAYRWQNGKLEKLGSARFCPYADEDSRPPVFGHIWCAAFIEIEEDFRRAGIASAIYGHLYASGYRVVPAPLLSDEARHFWRAVDPQLKIVPKSGWRTVGIEREPTLFNPQEYSDVEEKAEEWIAPYRFKPTLNDKTWADTNAWERWCRQESKHGLELLAYLSKHFRNPTSPFKRIIFRVRDGDIDNDEIRRLSGEVLRFNPPRSDFLAFAGRFNIGPMSKARIGRVIKKFQVETNKLRIKHDESLVHRHEEDRIKWLDKLVAATNS